MKKYRTFVSADADGIITGYHTTLVDENQTIKPPRPYQITDDEYILLKVHGHEKLYFNHETQCLHFKPEVKIVLDKSEIKANGKDIVKITVENVPDNIGDIEITIGGDKGKINPKTGAEITCDTAQSLFIQVTDPRVYCDYAIVEVTDAA